MKPNDSFSIGVLSARSGVSVPTIRYYEEIGLIPAAARRESGHRVYGTRQEASLGRVKSLRDLGFSLEQVRQALRSMDEGEQGAPALRALAQQQLHEVQARLSELRQFEARLQQIVATCAVECPSGPASRCSIMRDMAAGGAVGECC